MTTPLEACGCGEDRIPWMLTKYGFLGTATLALTTLLLMLATGSLLVATVWLLRRGPARTAAKRATSPPPAGPTTADPPSGLAAFTWRTEDEP
ncbi:hypothetical protein [Streptomyces sp. NPDC001315]|uniref:hypothetical protein n=1 Tax=Streptomyces sp. NPDC001315 TaxID=3364562 RepID=UPI0036AEB15E